ncbi:alanine dehydrogenase [Mycobacterium saskatchewanense]|nr:alanine dehydrogenase [Mycobacterium saskatchewanense]
MSAIGVPREIAAGERRVALVPGIVERLRAAGHHLTVEAGAGRGALIRDEDHQSAGAVIGDPWPADVVVKVNPPTETEISRMKAGARLIGFLAPRTRPEVGERLRDAGVTGFAMESVPRISRAQTMDALSSQANVAGDKAVLCAAECSTRFFPMMTTAAGTVKPASVLVLGVGVAGLKALATAKRLGARTTGFDVRPEVAEQVRSLGAKWLELGVTAAGEGGYARALTPAEQAEQQRRLTEAIPGHDVVITTALVPGRPAPTLVTADAVSRMRRGSVVIDLAGDHTHLTAAPTRRQGKSRHRRKKGIEIYVKSGVRPLRRPGNRLSHRVPARRPAPPGTLPGRTNPADAFGHRLHPGCAARQRLR